MCFSPIDFQWTSIIRRYWQTATKSCKSKTEWMLCIIIICSKSINDNDKIAHLSQRWCLGRTFCWWWVRTCRDSQTSRGEDAANRKAVDKMNMLKKKKKHYITYGCNYASFIPESIGSGRAFITREKCSHFPRKKQMTHLLFPSKKKKRGNRRYLIVLSFFFFFFTQTSV